VRDGGSTIFRECFTIVKSYFFGQADHTRVRRQLLTPKTKGRGGDFGGEGFNVTKSGDAHVVLWGFLRFRNQHC
jgi:hypothetical protein